MKVLLTYFCDRNISNTPYEYEREITTKYWLKQKNCNVTLTNVACMHH